MLVICALAMVALVARNQFKGGSVAVSEMPADSVVSDARYYHDQSRRVGGTNAKTEIVVFTDYQCPFCKRLWYALDSLSATDREAIAITVRHFPLDAIHPQARAASAFVECARREDRFRKADSILFAWPDSVERGRWASIASFVGMNSPATVNDCMASDEVATLIDADVAAARRLGATGTPVMLVNDVRVRGARSVEQVRRIVARSRRSD